MQRRVTIGWLLLFIPVTVLFYWRILLTRQFSLLTEGESINQGYSWMNFVIINVRRGILPIWDPYNQAGHSFAGEMQTAVFYPVHWLLAIIPFTRASVFSPTAYHWWFGITHLFAAWFMFALIREFGLSRFPAFLAGICFSLGGFVARMGWPHLLESSIWLPLVFLFFLRALRAASTPLAIVNACLGGLMFGLSVLAGGLHVAIMAALVIASAGIYHAVTSGFPRSALVTAVIGIVGVAAGAVQLFPSMEYGPRALRFLGAAGALPANQKIPYFDMTDQFMPHGIAVLVAPFAFNGNTGEGEASNPYIGVFPLLAAVIGIRRYWHSLWVRYLAGLAVAAFLFSIGNYSLLHGVLYAIVPQLWNMREASRMVYVLDFALVILAAHGLEALMAKEGARAGWTGLNRTLLGLVIACAAALFVPALFVKPEINPWNSLSILIIFASYGLYRYLEHGKRGAAVQAIMIALVLFDLSAANWTARDKKEVAKTGVNQLDRIMSARGAAQFLKAQPGLFRVRIQDDATPNLGDLFGISMVDTSGGATLPFDYLRMTVFPDLLNVRYTITPAKEQKPGAIYQDRSWKVYENPSGYSRGWIVHETMVEPSPDVAAERMGKPDFDARRTALVSVPVSVDPVVPGAQESAQVTTITPNSIELEVDAQSRGFLVLGEMYYPGWRATVEDQSVPIYRADSGLRGIVVPPGHSRVVLKYRPVSIYLGGLLSLLAFVGTLVCYTRYR